MNAGPVELNQASASAPTSPRLRRGSASGSERKPKPKEARSVTRNKEPVKSSQLMTKRTRKPTRKRAAKPVASPGYHWRQHGAGWDLRKDVYVTSHDGERKRKQPYVAHLSCEAFREIKRQRNRLNMPRFSPKSRRPLRASNHAVGTLRRIQRRLAADQFAKIRQSLHRFDRWRHGANRIADIMWLVGNDDATRRLEGLR